MENVEVDIGIMNEQAHALKRISFAVGAEKKASPASYSFHEPETEWNENFP